VSNFAQTPAYEPVQDVCAPFDGQIYLPQSKRITRLTLKETFKMFDLWRFGLEVQQVITARILRMMAGELSPCEALRMISEKQTAYTDAQIAGACGFLTGGPVEASYEMMDVYQRAVRANCARLA
jgi:hypothetical protein